MSKSISILLLFHTVFRQADYIDSKTRFFVSIVVRKNLILISFMFTIASHLSFCSRHIQRHTFTQYTYLTLNSEKIHANLHEISILDSMGIYERYYIRKMINY